MAHRYSVADYNAFLANLKTAYTDFIFKAYSGPQPASASDGATGTFLGNVTLAGAAFTPGSSAGGLEWGTPYLNVINKTGAGKWKFTCLTAGTIGYLRAVPNGTADHAGITTASTTLRRMDFSVSLTGGDGDITMTKITFNFIDKIIGRTAVITKIPEYLLTI